MNPVSAKAYELAERLRSSGQYAEYLAAKAVIDKNPDWTAAIEGYKRLLLSRGPSGESCFSADGHGGRLERKKLLSAAYYNLTANGDIRRFMDAERELLNLFGEALEIITSVCPAGLTLEGFSDEYVL